MSRRRVLAVLLLAAVFALPGAAVANGAACCAAAPVRGGESPALTCCDSGIACAMARPDAPQAALSARSLSDSPELSAAVDASFSIRIAFSARLSPTLLPRSPVNLTILHVQLLI